MNEATSTLTRADWTTVIPGGGGMSAGWRFDECLLPVPGRVRRAPSLAELPAQFLAEPDLYLNSLGGPNMHREVVASFKEAVKCFRAELFTASLAMLGPVYGTRNVHIGKSRRYKTQSLWSAV